MSVELLTAAALILAVVGTGLARRLALRMQVIAAVNERSSHVRPTPSGGGLGIAAAVVVTLLGSVVLGVLPQSERVWRVIGATVLAAGIGWRDDVRELPPRVKAVLLLAAAALLAWRPLVVVDVPYLGAVDLGILAFPLCLFWAWSFANLFNFMDGIDGIAGLAAVISAVVFAIAGWRAGDVFVTVLGSLVAASACGFLPWNFPRARVFMGDAGSLPLGLLLAYLALVSPLPFPAAMMLLGPFVFDTLFTMTRRAARGARLSEAHREHLYQRLARRWRGHVPVSLLFAGFSVVTGCLALGYDRLGDLERVLSLVLPLGAMLAFGAWVLRLGGGPDRGAPPAGDGNNS